MFHGPHLECKKISGGWRFTQILLEELTSLQKPTSGGEWGFCYFLHKPHPAPGVPGLAASQFVSTLNPRSITGQNYCVHNDDEH